MNLTKESLEQAVIEIKKIVEEGQKLTALKPTKLFMIRYPDETKDEFKQRCADAKTIANSMLKEKNTMTEDDDLNNMRYKAKYRYETKQPLTEEELKQCSYDADGFMISREDAMRAVERAHGIGVKDE